MDRHVRCRYERGVGTPGAPGRKGSRFRLAPRWRLALAASAVLPGLAARPQGALAHGGTPPAPHHLWSSWSWEPAVLLALALSAWLYARGARALWRRAGVGRGLRRRQVTAFVAGLAALFVTLVSPLDALGEALFSAHMVQHLGLTLVAAPLLILGTPPVLLLWALPRPWHHQAGGWWKRARVLRASWRTLSRPGMAWALYVAVLWIWHAPGLYQAALRSEAIHVMEHASFLGPALLFWWVLISSGRRSRIGYGAGVLYLFTTALQSSALGALITFSPRPWYPAYTDSMIAWGLTALEDQQLAGLIMWVPAGLIYVVTAAVLLLRWLQALERADQWSRAQQIK